MKNLTAKIMVVLACAIILMHAIVPHHHHDCEGEAGFVFESELTCHCDHDGCRHEEGHSHHPFDNCKLADMLSHLVLTTKDDEMAFSLSLKADEHDLPDMMAAISQWVTLSLMETSDRAPHHPFAVPILQTPLVGSLALRAPPAWA